MKDKELEILTEWRFVPIVRYSDPSSWKGPRYKGWQLQHKTLDQIPQDNNIGVILGPASNGILAIDFDGPWAWDYWEQNIQIPFDSFDTVMWTSNKPGRCQMAFKVPKEFWEYVPTKFSKAGPLGDDGKPQQLEFRWGNDESGFQSVLPPSIHPDNVTDPNINYQWLRKPSEVEVCEVPMRLLEWAILDRQVKDEIQEATIYEPKSIDGEEANLIAQELKRYYPSLDYEEWIRVTWAFCNAVGPADGIAIMKYYYPETKKNEYKKLMNSRTNGKVCTIGTVIKMIKDRGGYRKKVEPLSHLFKSNVKGMI